jgi:hypothetical protein
MAKVPKDQVPEQAPQAAPAPAQPTETPPPPGPGRWRYDPETGTHTRLTAADAAPGGPVTEER